MRHRSTLLVSIALAAAGGSAAVAQTDDDPFGLNWLEDVTGTRSMKAVARWNLATEATLGARPGASEYKADTAHILGAKDRLATPVFAGNSVFRFAPSPDAPEGAWQQASAAAYRAGEADWATLIDIAKLAREEGKPWAWRGAMCRLPRADRCLVMLSDGGKDDVEIREFDTARREFVRGGFRSPESKGGPTHLELTDAPVDWIDDDTIILTRNWGEGTLTAAGYGFVVKTLRRGDRLEDATEVFRGKSTDVSAMPIVLRRADGSPIVIVSRRLSFFDVEYHVLTPDGPKLLPFPKGVTLRGLVEGRLLATLRQDWVHGSHSFPEGSIVAIDVDRAVKSPQALVPELVMAPGARQAIDFVTATRDHAVAVVYDNVRGQIFAMRPGTGGWRAKQLQTPDFSSVSIVGTSRSDNSFSYVTQSFLEPETLWLGNADEASSRIVAKSPGQFKTSDLVVKQFEAPAPDGVRIPYYLVHKRGADMDGTMPTLLCSYGGLQYILAPQYYPLLGKLWLERGGAFVQASIRGGGEFGPAWHRVAQRAKRQITFDDYAAVARDLSKRKITSPRHLGIRGASNGGYQAGVQLTQRPEYWNAAIISVALLDMVRYPKMLAGASWIAEFGDPADPAEGAFLRSISPLHRLDAGKEYPPPLLLTSTTDNRVHPAHSRKFVARMEQLGKPFYYLETPTGGHGGGGDGGPCGLGERADLEVAYLDMRLR